MAFAIDGRVRWRWGDGVAEGVVVAVHESRTEKTIKGATVVRNANPDCPAYTIEQDDGDVVLKSATEVRAA